MVLQRSFPPDIRVEKEAKALLKEGYNVFLLAEYNGEPKKEEEVNGVIVRGINLGNTLLKKYHQLRFYLTFKHPSWEREIKKFVKDFNIEILHIHDLPLVKTGLEVAANKKLQIIADLHENYPAGLQVWRGTNKTKIEDFFLGYLKSLRRWKAYERKCVEQVDKVIVVVEEAKERLLSYGIPGKKITVISNVVDIDNFTNMNSDLNIIQKYKDNFVISYVGGFGPHRGIDCTIKAMKYLKENISKVRLVLVGNKNTGYADKLRQSALTRRVYDLIDFIGWQPFRKVRSYLKASDICLVPHNKNPHTDTTIPHKLFQYMLEGKPVVVSSCRPLKRIVEETNSGLVFEAGNEKDLAEKLVRLFRDGALRKELGENGRKAVQRQYNWQKGSKKLVNLYREL